MDNFLVKVVKISKLEKHPNADKLEIVIFDDIDWTCIVRKGMYTIGDLVVYIQPDAVIPKELIDKHGLEFLKKDGRVKTIKLRGVISQGLVLPIPSEFKSWKKGKYVSSELNIKKYEPPVKMFRGGIIKKVNSNSTFNKYTKITNIKNYKNVFEKDEFVYITEKIHGTNFRAGYLPRDNTTWLKKLMSFFKSKYEFVYGSHNVQKDPTSTKYGYYKNDVYLLAVEIYNLKYLIPNGYTFYGEVYGKGIQDLEYGQKGTSLFIFDIMKNGNYLNIEDTIKMCRELKLPFVPILYRGKYSDKILKECTIGNSTVCDQSIREGCVIRPKEETFMYKGGRKIFKSINPEYLLRKGGTENH